MSRKNLKFGMAVLAVIVLTTTILWASANTNVRNPFSAERLPPAEQQMNTPSNSTTDGLFTVALEHIAASQERVAFAYSVEAVTEEANESLMSESFNSRIEVKLPPDSGVLYDFMPSETEMQNLRTDTKKYFYCYISGLENPEKLPLFLTLNIMAEEEKTIELPLGNASEVLEFELDMAPDKSAVIRISALDAFVVKDAPEGFSYDTLNMDIFFRMKDDSIKTLNELFDYSGGIGNGISETGMPNWETHFIAHYILDLSQIKSIIVGNLEYDLNDISRVKEVALDETLLPFVLKDVYYDYQPFMLPVREVIEKLGGEVTIDPTGKGAVIQYRDSIVEIQVNTDYFIKDGRRYEYDWEPNTAIMNDGVLVMGHHFFWRCFHVMTERAYIDPNVYYMRIIP